MKKILLTNLMMLSDEPRFRSVLEGKGFQVISKKPEQFFNEKRCLEMVGDIDGWLAGDDEITSEVIQKALPKLKVISKWGTGTDSIDLVAARDNGVEVFNSPAAFEDAVAETALAYMLELARGTIKADQSVREGQWPKTPSLGLMGQSLGIIGLGAIGRGIAKRAEAFSMQVNYFDPHFDFQIASKYKRSTDLEHLLQSSNFICLACNMAPENYHLINKNKLDLMGSEAFLINVARGALVDEQALINSLKEGSIAGAALDVFEVEPLPMSSQLRTLNSVILGSHNANNVSSVVERVHQNTLNNLFKVLLKSWD